MRGGHVHGATDELGYAAVEQPVTVADFHATVLHLLGLDHERVTFPFEGRDESLTGSDSCVWSRRFSPDPGTRLRPSAATLLASNVFKNLCERKTYVVVSM